MKYIRISFINQMRMNEESNQESTRKREIERERVYV